MPAWQPSSHDGIARKWLALAERRAAHFIDLRDSGRWEYYYTLPKFYDALRAAFEARDEWARIVGVSPPEGGVSA
jgi:hypothetical protein